MYLNLKMLVCNNNIKLFWVENDIIKDELYIGCFKYIHSNLNGSKYCQVVFIMCREEKDQS